MLNNLQVFIHIETYMQLLLQYEILPYNTIENQQGKLISNLIKYCVPITYICINDKCNKYLIQFIFDN